MLFIVANINPNLYVSCTPLINVEALVHINVEVSSRIVPSVDDSKHGSINAYLFQRTTGINTTNLKFQNFIRNF